MTRAPSDPTAAALIDQLVMAVALSRGAWDNALDLGLLPERHRATAEELRDGLDAALAAAREWMGK